MPRNRLMKLSKFAQQAGVCYKTAWRWWKAGKIKGYQMETGTVVITEEMNEQAERLGAYCGAKGWKVVKVVKEVGSGVNDGRKKLLALLADPTVTIIVVEHKDRLTRFGFRYIETLLAMQGRSIEVVNV